MFDYTAEDARYLAGWAARIVEAVTLPGRLDPPIYVLATSLYPQATWFPPAEQCGGFFHPWLAPLAKEYLADWRGPGQAVAIHDAAIAEAENRGGESRPPEFIWHAVKQSFLAAVLHETCHALTAPLTAAATSEFNVAPAMLGEARATFGKAPPPTDAPPWFMHEAQFIRAACHLAERCERLGYRIRHWLLAAGDCYGLSPFSRYAAALGDEPQRSMEQSVRNVLASEPPTDFAALWAADTTPTVVVVAPKTDGAF